MEIFHYLADQLKDEELFDSPPNRPATEGAIYNDFDESPLDQLCQNQSERFCFSQTSNSLGIPDESDNAEEHLTREAVDHAIMAEDSSSGVHYEHLQWEHPLFDNFSDIADVEYLTKVYQLAINEKEQWNEIKISKEATSMFERRLRSNWESADSVYDSWLLRRGCERACFDYHSFHVLFPDFLEKVVEDDEERQECEEKDETPQSPPMITKKRSGSETSTASKRLIMTDREMVDEEEDRKDLVKFQVIKKICNKVIIISDSEEE